MSEHLDRMDRERVMSESSARAERRDLRRAMGPHVQAFASDTKQAIQTLQAGIDTLQQQVSEDRRRIHGLSEMTRPIATDHFLWTHSTFWGRLWWVLSGKPLAR